MPNVPAAAAQLQPTKISGSHWDQQEGKAIRSVSICFTVRSLLLLYASLISVYISTLHSKPPREITPSRAKMWTDASTVTLQHPYSWRFSVHFMWFAENSLYKSENIL